MKGRASGPVDLLGRVLDKGLVIQKVKQLGGQLTVRSALGEGATFTLTLSRWPRDDR